MEKWMHFRFCYKKIRIVDNKKEPDEDDESSEPIPESEEKSETTERTETTERSETTERTETTERSETTERTEKSSSRSVSFLVDTAEIVQASTSSKIYIEDEKYGTVLKPVSSHKVRFAISEDVREIPGRTLWQRRFKPCCLRTASVCCMIFYMMCFPFVELLEFFAICCQRIRNDNGKI